MNSMFMKIFELEKIHVFLNEEEMMQIINNIRFFNFKTDFSGMTKKRLLLIYIQGFLSKDYPNYINESTKKLIYLGIIVIVFIHEILGHLNLRIQNYLSKIKKLKSPIPEHRSEYANQRNGREFGEYIEEKLFGNYENKMTIKEILFILDVNNYKVKNYNLFKNNFNSCNNSNSFKISEELANILALYKINIKDLDLKPDQKFSVNKSIYDEKISFPPRHSVENIHYKKKEDKD